MNVFWGGEVTEYRAFFEASLRDGDGGAAVTISAIETERLLVSDPAAAEARARQVLAQRPDSSDALMLLGAALRRQGEFATAKDVLAPLTQEYPGIVLAHFELGLAFAGLGKYEEAICVLTRVIDLVPNFAAAWDVLAEQLDLLVRPRHIDLPLQKARSAVRRGQLAAAESLLRDLVREEEEAEAATFLLSIVLLAQERGREALPLTDKLLMDQPGNSLYRDLHAAALFQIEDFEGAIAVYEEILNDFPERPGAWMSYGRASRALGRLERCIAAFKKAIDLLPEWIEPYRTLASVKGYRLTANELAALRTFLARSDLPAAGYAELHFALGRALEDAGEYAEAFENFRRSQRIQRANVAYDADVSARWLRREMAVFTAAFLRERAGSGCPSSAPIFVVGMPRAGSTLVQEILCAHSAIERTGELRDLTWMAARLDEESSAGAVGLRYPEVLRTYDGAKLKSLGEEYLQRAARRRKLGRTLFVDKYPGNFVRTGLIHLILPNAKIIDVRRHPLDCCLSCFKNYFPEGQLFSHNLIDVGRYYTDYVELMAHFDNVLPGKVHRVIYEQLVENPENEVRRLFDYLGQPFEDQCLRFYQREQAIMTSSTEQVRMPIYKTGVGTWRRYEQWISPLRSALGRVLESYPAVPRFYSNFQVGMTIRLA